MEDPGVDIDDLCREGFLGERLAYFGIVGRWRMRDVMAIGQSANPPGSLLGEGVNMDTACIPEVGGYLDGCLMPLTDGAKLRGRTFLLPD